MVVKVKEYFEKTKQVENKDKFKKFVLRGQRNARYHEKIISNKKNPIISTFNADFLEDYNRYNDENFSVHSYFNELSNDISHFVVAQNFIISTCLSKVLTINFLEDGKRYKVEIFSVN